MAKILQFIVIITNFLQLIRLIEGNDTVARHQKFTSRCDSLCANVTTELRPNCIRGCQYFNLEFLLTAKDNNKVVDLNEVVERCGATCSDAYTHAKAWKEQCFNGCNEMMLLQSKAPNVDGILVYMGATDQKMALLRSDFDKPAKRDWVQLNAILESDNTDYDYVENDVFNLSEDRRKHPNHRRFAHSYCIPTWMWMLPVLLVVMLVWLNYSNYIHSMFIHEGLRQELSLMTAVDTEAGLTKKLVGEPNAYGVGNEFYFYPMPAVPPPKYDESILLTDDDKSPRDTQPEHC